MKHLQLPNTRATLTAIQLTWHLCFRPRRGERSATALLWRFPWSMGLGTLPRPPRSGDLSACCGSTYRVLTSLTITLR